MKTCHDYYSWCPPDHTVDDESCSDFQNQSSLLSESSGPSRVTISANKGKLVHEVTEDQKTGKMGEARPENTKGTLTKEPSIICHLLPPGPQARRLPSLTVLGTFLHLLCFILHIWEPSSQLLAFCIITWWSMFNKDRSWCDGRKHFNQFRGWAFLWR